NTKNGSERCKNDICPSGPADPDRVIAPQQFIPAERGLAGLKVVADDTRWGMGLSRLRDRENLSNIDFFSLGIVRGLGRHQVLLQQKLFPYLQEKQCKS